MNWFSILKEQRQVTRNIQSFKPIQLDKPIKIKKPEEDCVKKLIDYLRSKYSGNENHGDNHIAFPSYASFFGDEISAYLNLPNLYEGKGIHILNEEYCQILDHLKSLNLEELEAYEKYKAKTVGQNLEIFYKLNKTNKQYVDIEYLYNKEQIYYPLLYIIMEVKS